MKKLERDKIDYHRSRKKPCCALLNYRSGYGASKGLKNSCLHSASDISVNEITSYDEEF